MAHLDGAKGLLPRTVSKSDAPTHVFWSRHAGCDPSLRSWCCRYWRYDEDGTYIICFDSIQHRACPPVPGTIRADMHAVYTVSPKKNIRSVEFDESPESLLTYILQVGNPP